MLLDLTRPLDEATVQEIHLELIRRTDFNNFHGKRILADLLAHRSDWQAVLLDRYGLAGESAPVGLIKLRDVGHNYYNADTLYILTTNEEAAQRLSTLGEVWLADSVHIYSHDETGRALGVFPVDLHLVEMWWD